MSYYFSKTMEIPFSEAVTRVIEELKKEGFGILTDVDVKATWLAASNRGDGDKGHWSRP